MTGNFKGYKANVDDDNDSTVQELHFSQQTDEYKVPSDKFKTDEDIFRLKGYHKDSMTLIASGGQSLVFKITKSTDNSQLAVKVIDLKVTDERYKKKVKDLKNEIRIISRVIHKNIIRLEDHFIINTTCYLFMELANGGDLEHEVCKRPLDETRAKNYFLQIVKGVDHLHSQTPPIAHNDLKLNNILIHLTDTEKVLKITDFGFSKVIDSKHDKTYRMSKPEGTMPYMSPQLINLQLFYNLDDELARQTLKGDRKYKAKTVNPIKADMWALGVCLYRMVSGEFPFDYDRDWSKMVFTVQKMQKKSRNPIEVSPQLNDLLDKLLEPDTKYRIDIKALRDHKWLIGAQQVIPIDN